MDRRRFLHYLAHTGVALGAMGQTGGWLRSVQAGQILSPHSRSDDYRALVCIDLKGGNDGFNTVIPTGSGTGADSYEDYQSARGGVFNEKNNAQGIALPETDILPLTTPTGQARLGIHNSMPEVQQLFNRGKAGVVANVGTLVRPTDKNDYQNGMHPLPAHLFSHSDQQMLWLAPSADSHLRQGWGGRLADKFSATHANVDLPMNISTGGENVFQVGQQSMPFFVEGKGAISLRFAPQPNGVCKRSRGQCESFQKLLSHRYNHPLRQANADILTRAIARNTLLDDALKNVTINDTLFEPFWAAFGVAKSDQHFGKLPKIAQQLFLIARLIRVQSVLAMRRQTFYARMGGYDTHDAILTKQAKLLAELSKSIGAFQQVLASMDMQDKVTTFTASEFGRTTSSNGDGSDHGWGSHHFVIGGAVKGGRLFGRLPQLSPEADNPDNAKWGQIIPTLAADQYAVTLARWFGLPDSDIASVFPNLAYMTGKKLAIAGSDLGFMRL
ncbi:MAG: hypothetical protein CR975_07310 [Gammaproteobacteria bacterium]|nr:MAG: hypothetical protein CR975_07310 [Gammaproteobacteria bacterium]